MGASRRAGSRPSTAPVVPETDGNGRRLDRAVGYDEAIASKDLIRPWSAASKLGTFTSTANAAGRSTRSFRGGVSNTRSFSVPELRPECLEGAKPKPPRDLKELESRELRVRTALSSAE